SFHLERKELVEARQLAEQAIAHQRIVLESNPLEPVCRQFLANHYRTLTETLVRLGEHEEAVKIATEAPQLYPASAEECRRAAEFLARCVPLAAKDAKVPEDKRKALAEQYAVRAVEFLRSAVQKGYKNVGQLKKDPDLETLRPRDDFMKLIAELEEKGK